MMNQVQAVTARSLSVVDKLRLLLDITKRIASSLDPEEVLGLVMETLPALLPYDACGIYIIEPPSPGERREPNEVVFRSEMVRGYDIEELMELRLKAGEGIIGYVAQTGEAVISPNVKQDPRYINARERTQSEMVAPIISNEKIIGVFDLESDELNAYTPDDLEVLKLLSTQVAIILEKAMLHEQLVEKKRLEAQLEIARSVQLSLLPPSNPSIQGFDIAAYNYATDEVSGDYFDFVSIYDDMLALVIADVSGKGIPAALLMAFLRATLRAAIRIGYAPHISLSKANALLRESIKDNQYITAFYGVLDATNKTLSFANAGHNPPLLLEADGITARYLERGELPLGMFDDARYYEHHLQLASKQILVLYTDGVTEAENRRGAEYGRERLAAIVAKGKDDTARELLDEIYADVMRWTGERGVADDVTFIVVRVL